MPRPCWNVEAREGGRASSLLLLILVPWLLTACESAPTAHDQQPESPQEIATGTGSLSPSSLNWWTSFNDPVLNEVVERALSSNLHLEQAASRVLQARARARIARSFKAPIVSPSLGASESEGPTNADLGAQLDELGFGGELVESLGFALPDRLQLQNFGLNAEFAYEIDFWGRVSKDALASDALRSAVESDMRSAQIAVLSETIATYLEILELSRIAQLTHEMIDLHEHQLAWAQARYEQGVSDALSFYTVKRDAVHTRARLPGIEAALSNANARLWVLLGGYSEHLAEVLTSAQSPMLSPQPDWLPVPQGVPADLLTQRPDVSAARERMHAAGFSLGARRAELLPSLSLSGVIGLRGTAAEDWFDPDQWFQNIGLNLFAPALQGGRLRANVELAESRWQEATATYKQSVVQAVNEVQDAFAKLHARQGHYGLSIERLNEAEAEMVLQDARYASGIADFGEFISARHLLLTAKHAQAASAKDLALARLGLHRALGGTWAATPASLAVANLSE